jgi:DNA-binding CsgD family transcriptional regulator
MGARQACPDLVGRSTELEVLLAALSGAMDGQASTVLVGGEAGVGKTRLIAEVADRARVLGALVVTASCVPSMGGGLPYAPVVGLLRDLGRQADGSAASELLDLVTAGASFDRDSRADHEVYTADAGVADEVGKIRLFESVRQCLASVARGQPLMVVFEDLHWADSATVDLLSFLVRNLDAERVLVVGTYRNDEIGRDHPLHRWLVELSRHGRVDGLTLDRFDRDEITAFITGVLGHAPDWALVDGVWSRSGGNAFFAEELIAARHSASLSPELRGVVMARFDQLGEDEQALLRVVAAAGTAADDRVLLAVADGDPAAVERDIASLVEQSILVVDADSHRYRFRHELLREAVVDSLLPGEAVRLHRAIADALVEVQRSAPPGRSPRAAELAVQWWGAGAWSEAFHWSLVAADEAAEMWAFPEALAHVDRAIGAVERGAGPEERGLDHAALLERGADLAYFGGSNQRSVDLARAAVEATDERLDPKAAARRWSLLGRNSWVIGDSDGAFAAYRRAAGLVPADQPSVELARILAEEGRGYLLMSRQREAVDRCRHAIAVARAVGARAEESHALCTLGSSLSTLGRHDEGVALLCEALAVAEEIASPEDLNRAYGNLGSVLMEAGRFEEAASVVVDSATVGEQLWGLRLNGAAGNSTESLIRLGRYDEAAELLDQLVDDALGACIPAPFMLPAMIDIRVGRFDDAERNLAVIDEITAELGDVQQRGGYHLLRAELLLASQGSIDDAYSHLEHALTLAAGTDDSWYRSEMCTLALRCLGDARDDARASGRAFDLDKARLLAAEHVALADSLVAIQREEGGSVSPVILAAVATCRAEASRLRDPDPDAWTEAADGWAALGDAHLEAYCRWREAESALTRGGAKAAAAAALQRAWSITDRIGELPLRTHIEELARRARIAVVSPDAPTDGDGDGSVGDDLGLTPREVEVLGQLAAGRRDAEIAEALFISKKTASVHVSNILRKLEVPNRVEAGRIGQAYGLG